MKLSKWNVDLSINIFFSVCSDCLQWKWLICGKSIKLDGLVPCVFLPDMLKLKLLVLVGPLSAIQPFNHPLTFNFPWSLGYIRKLAFGSPWGNYFTPGFVCSQHTVPRNIKLAQKQPSQGTNSHLLSSRASEIHFCALRNSR